MDRSAGRETIEAAGKSNEASFVLGAGLILSYLMICLAMLGLGIIDLAYYLTFLCRGSCCRAERPSPLHHISLHWYFF
jgi:hypothetical protein